MRPVSRINPLTLRRIVSYYVILLATVAAGVFAREMLLLDASVGHAARFSLTLGALVAALLCVAMVLGERLDVRRGPSQHDRR